MADMPDDWTLLEQYVQNGSREALDELVRRYSPLVYGTAMRRTGRSDLSEEVTQMVFMVLMRNAARLSRNVVLGGWLFTAAKLTAAQLQRGERRRRRHERKAAAMRTVAAEPVAAGVSFDSMRLVDEAIDGLSRIDRDAVVMRYLQGLGIGEIAQALQMNENAVRQRIFRALRKVRGRLRRGQIGSSGLPLGAVLPALRSPHLVPSPEMVGRVVAALHASPVVGGSSLSGGLALRMMVMAKVKSISIVLVVLVLLISAAFELFSPKAVKETVSPPPAAAEQATAKPAAPSPVQVAANTPNASLLRLVDAIQAGDVDLIVSGFEPLPAEQEAALRKAAGGTKVVADLREAVADRFGSQTATDLFREVNLDPPDLILMAMSESQPVYHGDTAEIALPRVGAIEFVKRGEAWKLRSSLLPQAMSFLSQFATAEPGLAKVCAEVKAGRFHDAAELTPALRLRLEPDPGGAPTERPAVTGAGATPRDTLAALEWAQVAGDQDAAAACFTSLSADQRAGLQLSTNLYHRGEELRAAVADRFGLRVARDTILTLGLDPGFSKQMLERLKGVGEVSGERALIDLPAIGVKMEMQKVDGTWKIEPASIGLGSNPKWRVRMEEFFLPKDDQLIADVRAGKYPSPNELKASVDALHREFMAERKKYVSP